MVHDEGEWLLIDIGFRDTTDEIIDLIRQLDFSLASWKYLVATHADDDHTQYLLASNLGSRITATANWTDLTDKGLTDLHHHITISASEPAVPYAYQIWIDT